MIDNFCSLYGRLVRDPEYTEANGDKKQYAKFRIAVNRTRGDDADFIDCIVFGKRADVIREWFSKGQGIRVIGAVRIEKYTDKNGNNREKLTIMVDDFGFDGSKSNKSGRDPVPRSGADSFEEVEKDVPF